MKTLTTLIRYKKQLLDELRRKLASLESQKEKLVQRSEGMQRELEKEIELATTQPEMGGFFGDFAERIRKRRAEIAAEIAKIERQMVEQAEKIRESFSELKRFEILRERRIAEGKAKEARRETEQLDEVAMLRHRREEK
jgi:flagellar protein FliJ